MRAFICSLLGHRFSWIIERRTGVVTAVCRRCNRPILCPYPKGEPENAIEAGTDAASP
ncbi:MAG TPA: hypothetical protein VHU83_19850 [Bryobacteraceae bacterium]|jgi:hypothetical protein|nr:hypothetical protein [Bryobacteraceae bacterium]